MKKKELKAKGLSEARCWVRAGGIVAAIFLMSTALCVDGAVQKKVTAGHAEIISQAQELKTRKGTDSGSVIPLAVSQETSKSVESVNGLEALGPEFLYEQQAETERKREHVKALVTKGVKLFNENSFAQACSLITHSAELRDGELYLWLHALDGTVMAHGDTPEFIWQNMYDFRDDFGFFPVQGLIKKALAGGGWQAYRWNKATKLAYVQLVEKDGQKYEIGSGYYALSKAEEVVTLVKAATSLFNTYAQEGLDTDVAFGAYMYPFGKFIYGDLYLYVLDDKGVTLVHGEKPELASMLTWDVKDSKGKYFVQEIITKLKKKPVGEGVWVQYISKNAVKNSYAERVEDKKGKSYFIVSGFYPDVTRASVTDLVAHGYAFLKTYGKSAAKEAFLYTLRSLDLTENPFVYGDLFLFLIDFNGTCIAFGNMPEYSGKNLLGIKDENGRYMLKEVIENLKKEDRAWMDFKVKNAFWSVYVERIEVGVDQLIIGCGFYPVTKMETMHLMVNAATEYLRTNEDSAVFRSFVKQDSKFIRGDLEMFALDADGGTCYAWGNTYDLIWKNLAQRKDQAGHLYIQSMIDSTARGTSGTLGAQENNAHRVYYVEPVIKNNRRYIVGSGFYP